MGDITLEELSAKIADRAQPLRDKVLTVIYALQFEGGGGPVRASEIQQLLAMAEFEVELSMIEAMIENLQVTGLIEPMEGT